MDNILIQGTAAAFIGLAIGYSFKKFVKVGLFLLGVSLMLLFAAESYDIITVSDQGVMNAGQAVLNSLGGLWNFFYDRLSQFPSATIGAVAGLVTGFKQG